MSLSSRYLGFVKEWNLIYDLQKKIPTLKSLCVPNKGLLEWAFHLASHILNKQYRGSDFLMKDLDLTLVAFWKLVLPDMSTKQQFLWANAHSGRVVDILLEAQREAQWVSIFFHERGIPLSKLYSIPLLKWSCSSHNKLLNLSI